MKMGRMDRIEVFRILGIEETKDEGRIKAAYRERLSAANPEDDPEGFKRLRSAYEEASRMAKESDGDQAESPRDTTPSGLWAEKAAGIYNNIRTRQDISQWEKLFAEDCFLSLEDEDNCRFKLLRFLTEHIKLPTEVWKLLNKKLSIVEDAAKLREQFPVDFVRYVLNKCERGEEVDFSQFQGPEDGDYDLFLQYYDRTWQALSEDRLEDAAQYIEDAGRLGISHPVMEICRGDLLNRQGKPEEAVALMEDLRGRYPQDAMVCYHAAEMLWKQGQAGKGHCREKAARIYQELIGENEDHYMANFRLAEWHYGNGEYKKAKKCAEKVISTGTDEAFMELLAKINAEIEKELEKEYRETKKWEPALELCWCYLQDGKIARGIMLAVCLEKQLPPEKEAEFDGLMTKLYLEEAEYEDAVVMADAWEEALLQKLESDGPEKEKEKDRDRLRQSHLIRMQCYHNLGFADRTFFGKAVEEGNQLLSDSAKDIGILLEQAQIYIEMEEYERCQELTDKLVERYQIFAAYAVSMEANLRQLDASGVIQSGAQCIRYFPDFAKAYEYIAKVFLDLGRTEDLERVLEDAEKKNVKSEMLNAYRYQLRNKPMEYSILNNKLRHFRDKYFNHVEQGEMFLYQEGLGILTEYLYNCPDSYMFVERGLYHKAAHRYAEAKEDLEKALSLAPANPYALNGLEFVYKYMGDFEKALVCAKKALLYMGDAASPVVYQDIGHLYSLLGDHRRALASHLQYKKLTEGTRMGRRGLDELAECRLRMGQVDKADQMYRQIYAEETWNCYLHRVDLYGRSGDERRARELLEDWRKELGLGKDSFLGRHLRRIKGSEYKRFYSDFFLLAAWTELLFGTRAAALRNFRDAIACNTENGREDDLLGDVIFGCIVCGEDRQGKKYSEKLKVWLNQESYKARDRFFNRAKSKLYLKILSDFYTASPEAIQELFNRKEKTEICHYCTNPFCKELEGIHIMFLYRQGKHQEALERLTSNLELLPQDEHMLAIRHTVFGAGKVSG